MVLGAALKNLRLGLGCRFKSLRNHFFSLALSHTMMPSIIGCTSHHINLNFCLLEHDGLRCLCIFVYVCLFFAFFLYLSLCKDFLYRKETTGLNGVGATKTGIETVTSTETRIETVTSTETVIDGAMMTASDPGTRISTSRTMSGTTKNSGMLVC